MVGLGLGQQTQIYKPSDAMSERVTVREFQISPERWVVDADFAHRLADELDAAKERIEMLEALVTGENWTQPNRIQSFEATQDGKAVAEMLRIVEAKP